MGHCPSPKVLLLPPNLVGHLRLAVLLAAVAAAGNHGGHTNSSALAILASLALDALDGYLARHLDQVCCPCPRGPEPWTQNAGQGVRH
jgi:phosphatidylglycerophosphate synthase